MGIRISYEKVMREKAKNEGKVLVTVDLNAKAVNKGAFCIQGAFLETDLVKLKEAFIGLMETMGGNKLAEPTND